MESTQPGIFHIHIDGHGAIPPALEAYAINTLGFFSRPFNGHPEGSDHFEPDCELTLKTATKKEFREAWAQLEVEITKYPTFTGYVEGEFIPIDEFIPCKEYNDIPVPFKIAKRVLTESEGFRQTEIHLTMDRHTSHPDLIQKLLDSGLYAGYIQKPNAEYVVFTVQGFIREIKPLMESMRKFLYESGGADKCTIKEERALAHILCNIDVTGLPEVADEVTYLS